MLPVSDFWTVFGTYCHSINSNTTMWFKQSQQLPQFIYISGNPLFFLFFFKIALMSPRSSFTLAVNTSCGVVMPYTPFCRNVRSRESSRLIEEALVLGCNHCLQYLGLAGDPSPLVSFDWQKSVPCWNENRSKPCLLHFWGTTNYLSMLALISMEVWIRTFQ